MNKNRIVWLLLTMLLFPCSCLGQGAVEFGGTQASVVGLGAGLAASLNHGKVVRHSYEAAVKAQQAAVTQSKAIEQYMKIGCDLEAKKRWAEAEESFKYVLRVIARRDGPGSAKSVAPLEHLVSVTKSQDKLNDAISFQKTVLNFRKSGPAPNVSAIVNAQNNLSDLFEQSGDYASAEPLLRDSVKICNTCRASLSASQINKTVTSYTKVLRKLKKDSEAEDFEANEAKNLLTGDTMIPSESDRQVLLPNNAEKVITTEQSMPDTTNTTKSNQH